MKIELSGGLETALTHFAMLGLASILADSGATNVRIWWRNDTRACATVEWQGKPAENAVHEHARRHTFPSSWVQITSPRFSTEESGNRPTAGLFSPRQSFPNKTQDWESFMAARERATSDEMTQLDWRMLGGLGEPGHWLLIDNKPRPEAAASRWEMVPRNGGKEFVGKRLAPLAHIIATRTEAEILAGLDGSALKDELAKDSAAFRTATGLCKPRLVDNALAWCALWGLSCFPVVPRARELAFTPAAAPRNRTHPKSMTLPVWDHPVSVALWRTVVASEPLGTLTGSSGLDDAVGLTDEAFMAVQSLQRIGVLGLIRFPIHTNNPSAPERQILDGRLVFLHDLASLSG